VDHLLVLEIVAGTAGATSLTIRRFIVALERRGERKFARHIFDKTNSTDALKGYEDLCRIQRPPLQFRQDSFGKKLQAAKKKRKVAKKPESGEAVESGDNV